MVDFGTSKVDSAHGRSQAWTTSPMGEVDRGQLGSKGKYGTDDLALLDVGPAHQ